MIILLHTLRRQMPGMLFRYCSVCEVYTIFRHVLYIYIAFVNPGFVKFEVLTVASVIMLFWVVKPCRLAVRYHVSEKTRCLHL